MARKANYHLPAPSKKKKETGSMFIKAFLTHHLLLCQQTKKPTNIHKRKNASEECK